MKMYRSTEFRQKKIFWLPENIPTSNKDEKLTVYGFGEVENSKQLSLFGVS